MISFQFKKDSGSAATDFLAVKIIPSFETEEKEFIVANKTRIRKVYAAWKKWIITFGILTSAQLDYLEELAIEENPQFIYNSVTYNVQIKDLKANPRDGNITVINVDKET